MVICNLSREEAIGEELKVASGRGSREGEQAVNRLPGSLLKLPRLFCKQQNSCISGNAFFTAYKSHSF